MSWSLVLKTQLVRPNVHRVCGVATLMKLIAASRTKDLLEEALPTADIGGRPPKMKRIGTEDGFHYPETITKEERVWR